MDFIPIEPSTIYLIVALAVLLVLSFIVAGNETALLATIKSQGSQPATITHSTAKLIRNPNKLAYSILILSNLLNIATVLITYRIIDTSVIFESSALAIAVKFIVVGLMVLIVSIYIPKTLAAHNYQGFAKFSSPITSTLIQIVNPLSCLLIKVAKKIAPEAPIVHESVSIEQLQSVIEATSEEASTEDKKIINSIATFIGREVSTIMKPRVDVTAIDSEASFSEVMQIISTSKFSRVPVYQNSFDEIAGLLFAKDLLPYIDQNDSFNWHKLLREPYFVPEGKKINDLLEDFQAQHRHLAIVVDEYGGTLGIVTLEDILEEIVGEITDETDTTSDFYKIISDGIYLFDGSTHIEDFGEVLSIDEDALEESKGCADTLAGLMMELRGAFFSEGDEVTFENLTLRAEEIDRYRITKVLITRHNA